MNALTYLIFFLIGLGHFAKGQSISLIKICTLPNLVKESSGLETNQQGELWTHNDGEGEPALYKIDTTGNLLRTVYIKNVQNTDWEDLASDDSYFYIGDFGNNSQVRRDLKIFKIPNPDDPSDDSVSAEVIRFYYPNQLQFPPDNAYKNFDAEAFFAFNNQLYIFTKNYTNPFSGYTYLYRLPSDSGFFVAQLLDSFKTGIGYKEQWWVTAADISPDHKKVVLLSSDKIFVFTDFKGDDFFKGMVKIVDLGSFTQKEGFVFYNDTDFYISDEYHQLLGGQNLYKGSLKNLNSLGLKETEISKISLVSYKRQFGENIITLVDDTKKVSVSVIDLTGKIVTKHQLDNTLSRIVLDLPKGIYTILMSDGTVEQEMKIRVE